MNQFEQEVMVNLVRRGIVSGPEIEATKKKILDSVAPAVLADLRAQGKSDPEIIMMNMEAYFNNAGNNQPTADPSGKTETKPMPSTLTEEERRRFDMLDNLNAVKNHERSNVSRCVAVLTDQPVLASILVEGAMLTPDLPDNYEAKKKEYADNLVKDPDNERAFAELYAQWEKKSPMKVFVNPKAKPKIIGFELDTLNEAGDAEKKTLTMEDAKMFLLVYLNGYLAAPGETGIGLRIRWSQSKKKRASDSTGAKNEAGTCLVSVLNRKYLDTEAGKNLYVCTSTITDAVVNDHRCKTDASFKVYNGMKDDGVTPKMRTIRLSGHTSVKVVQRKEAYSNIFGAIGAKGSTGKMSKKAMESHREAVRQSLKAVTSGSMVMNSAYARQLAAQLQMDFNKVSTGANNAAPIN